VSESAVRILSIGNSFSQDAVARLHDMAAADGLAVMTANLYIGGCSLKTHWENDRDNLPLYAYEINGQDTGRMISIRNALQQENWDYVTMQQASHDSGLPETYQPYIGLLSQRIRDLAPQAEQLVHQTWAYETDSSHPAFAKYNESQQAMYEALRQAYQTAATDLGLRLIPSGEVIQALRHHPLFDYARGGQTLCRDGFHLHLVYGRYAASATWLAFIANRPVSNNPYRPESNDDPLAEAKLRVIRETVDRTISTLYQ